MLILLDTGEYLVGEKQLRCEVVETAERNGETIIHLRSVEPIGNRINDGTPYYFNSWHYPKDKLYQFKEVTIPIQFQRTHVEHPLKNISKRAL